VPGSQKQRLLDFPAVLARGLAEGGEPVSLAARALAAPPPAADGAFRFAPEAFSFHSRAFLKVQDGCDRRCAYCRVSLARGPSRSLPPDEALRRLRALEDAGFCETILTGVNLSQYASGGLDLGGLIHHLIAGTSTMRLRISSLEPEAVSPAFCEAISSSRVRPHFHLSVQSASPRVLARMGRPYGPEDLAAACARLRAAKDDPFLACDIIAGFPGETPADFAETLAFCRGALFAWIHAFRFSPRPDTAAWTLRPRVPEREACERVRALEEAARAGYAAYRRRWQGREVEAVILAAKNAAPPGAPALSENYLRLWLEPPPQGSLPPAGSLVLCRVREGESNTPSAEYVRSLSHRHSA
jgi:threonylcarbamoyladenosine tRNA methylthiotransferase MtaB